jgi:hypothetical protein
MLTKYRAGLFAAFLAVLHEMWTKESTDHVTFNVFRASASSRWLRTVFTSPTFNWRCSMFPASRSFIASLR